MIRVVTALLILFLLSPGAVLAEEGYDAGYEYAEQNDIDDPLYGEIDSDAFNEGFQDYAEEQRAAGLAEAFQEEERDY